MDCIFFLNTSLLGVGLAMDAFSVSIVNAVMEPNMGRVRSCAIAGVYAFFQFIMPLAGWLCVHAVATAFVSFQLFIPWMSLFLLLFIGGKMVIEAVHGRKDACAACGRRGADCASCEAKGGGRKLTFSILLMQGVATSIDALSVGFTIAEYGALLAVECCQIGRAHV